ncbi:Exocyst complex protein Exo70 [Macleaya cordata]|uniref:Exocyst subunit Exo70 family protein n=1 Tax=Macleaya cordata TaxID=56857 RepID=A0A200R498_MACCD|nr:Exocyst complex protein Exo70 [Macleaya cordata]
MAATVDGDERVMAAAQKIVKSLGTSKNVTEDMILILSSFDNRLSTITDLLSPGGGGGGGGGGGVSKRKIDEEFEAAEHIVLRWDSNSAAPQHHSLPWEDSPDEAAEYLSAVDEILRLTEDLTLSSDGDIMERAESVLQLAMSRLEDEFRHILIRNTVPLDADRLYGSIRRVSLSFASNDGEVEDYEGSVEDDHESCYEERVGGGDLSDDQFVDLIHPDAVVDLKEIAERMIRSGYEKECCQVYCSVRRDVLDECLSIIGLEKLSIDEVQKMEWRSLDEKMKKWSQGIKIITRVLLSGEMRLCDQIFAGSELIREVCFTETAKGCVMQLLTFGEAIVIARRSSEKLFRILDMYDALAEVLPDLRELFSYESGETVYNEAQGILSGLGEAAKGTFMEFENAVQNETSRKPTQGGEIHPLTRYVMNYIKLLVDYSDTLNLLLKSSTDGSEGDYDKDLGDLSPVGCRLMTLISALESNLEEKSKLYEDGAMQYIFLMNNILYIVQKVKDSELGKLLGDHWVRKRRGQVRQYATGYLRASWSKVLSFLKDEGIGGGGSSSGVSKVVLKERFKSFNSGFEEIYRNQTAWKVTDPQLREELRISISEKVLPAYRSFMGRFGNHLESGRHAGKYIKYTPDDLENCLSDLFEGTPGVLHPLRRKLST